MKKASRQMMWGLRGALAIDRYLSGEDLAGLRKSLAISTSRWQRRWQHFKVETESQDRSPAELAEVLQDFRGHRGRG